MNGQLIKLMIRNIIKKDSIKLITDPTLSLDELINNKYKLIFIDLKMPKL